MLIEEISNGENEKIEFKENAKTNTYIKSCGICKWKWRKNSFRSKR